MNKRIHYIGQYSENIFFRNLRVFPSGLTKMNYILSCLEKCDFDITIFSPAETKDNLISHYCSHVVSINKKTNLIYIDTFGCPNLIFKILSRLWTFMQIIHYLFFYVKKDDVVLIYHTWMYRWPLRIVLFFRKLNLYFEVEEIFNAAWKNSDKAIRNEISYLKGAKGYILVNDMMKENLSITKPTTVCYGSYISNNTAISKASAEIIHIVYAGVIEGKESDIFLAIDILKYLPKNYCLDILGYGTTENILEMSAEIDNVNVSLSRVAVIYHGCLSGEEYYSFLAKSHIGLCSRVLEDRYSDFTFPSKILVYLGNNLVPVCTPIRALMKSSLNGNIIFSENINAESLAKAILAVDLKKNSEFDQIIKKLDKQFCSELNDLLKNNDKCFIKAN